MKKLLILIVLAGIGYKGYTDYIQGGSGAFDENGEPTVLLFTVAGCGKPCRDANRMLQRRGVGYEEVVVTDGKEQEERWERFGAIRNMPVLVTGDRTISGYNKWDYVSALAESYDNQYLYVSEADIFDKNFTDSGDPKLVMYTMDGCGYCEAAMQQLRNDGIDFEERNTSVSTSAKMELDKFQAGTPLIFYGYRRFVGWSSEVHKSLMKVL